MSSLNNAWKYLIFIGIAALIGVVGWEFYQVSTGGRSEFNLVVVEMPRSVLFTKKLEEHLKADPLEITEVEVPAEE